MSISIFDIIKVGVGPSSSHTMGPWLAAQQCLKDFSAQHDLTKIEQVRVLLYGSLAKTGKGHGTDVAVQLGLSGYDYKTMDTQLIQQVINEIAQTNTLKLRQKQLITFNPNIHIEFHTAISLPGHPNGMQFVLETYEKEIFSFTYYSIGGGFISSDGEHTATLPDHNFPYPIQKGEDLLRFCNEYNFDVINLIERNELSLRSKEDIDAQLLLLWETMKDSIYRGCHAQGILPGGLNVMRRAAKLHHNLMKGYFYENENQWLVYLRSQNPTFNDILQWVSCFALAVNEENAAFGRIVTAPTNGAAGVVPAVLMYYYCFGEKVSEDKVKEFLMVAGQIGSIFKQGATISAAMGGCQAEIGVSSAMAAAALTHCLGGSIAHCLMAAEIAMEHHLGLTCDPVGGLVQIPCIERNSMGAVKAITAASLALNSDPKAAKVSLDAVVKTMWETALDMNHKYKETSEGGLALHIPVNLIEC
ncbi:MAG: L-serine ammonia-lyase [Chitinophagales bacterium]